MDIINIFYAARSEENSKPMTAYMKNKFPFLGLKKPVRNNLQKVFIKNSKKTKSIDWNFVFKCWELPEREFQYLALDYLIAVKYHLVPEDIEKLQKLIIDKSWWDTVDMLAATLIGELCIKYPDLIHKYICSWSASENIWLNRTAILFQLKYGEKTDTGLLEKIILQNKDTKEFFKNKAIGWVLRQYSKTNKEWVKRFIGNNSLHPLSVREGSKYL